MGTPEHGGRVRAAGSSARMSQYFGMPKRTTTDRVAQELEEVKKKNEDLETKFSKLDELVRSLISNQRSTEHRTPVNEHQGSCSSFGIAVPHTQPNEPQTVEPRLCLLAHPDDNVIVAKGKLLVAGPDDGTSTVYVEASFENDAVLPIATDEFDLVYDCIGGNVQWPTKFIEYDMTVNLLFFYSTLYYKMIVNMFEI